MKPQDFVGLLFLGVGLLLLAAGIYGYSMEVPIEFLGFTIGYERPYAERSWLPLVAGATFIVLGMLISSIEKE